MSRQVDNYFSLSSPWAYIGHKVLGDLAATYDLVVNHKPVVLVDLFTGLCAGRRARTASNYWRTR